MATKRAPAKRERNTSPTTGELRFEAANIDSVFEVLDAVTWLNGPTCKDIAQYAGVDPRTAGKLLKNAVMLGLVDCVEKETYLPVVPYPCKGSLEQKKAVVREALLRLPVVKTLREFLQLGEKFDAALRKAATVSGVKNYEVGSLSPLVAWAKALDALGLDTDVEKLLDNATLAKEERHRTNANKRVVFISHSSKDKPFVRKLAGDLTAAGIDIWLDEQRIRVGDSIPAKVAQGLAQSDLFLIVLSDNSVGSDWVQRELNTALVAEISKRNVSILPLKLSECQIPEIIRDKKYADFTGPYRDAFEELLRAIREPEQV